MNDLYSWEALGKPAFAFVCIVLVVYMYCAWAWRKSALEVEIDLGLAEVRIGIEKRRGDALQKERDQLAAVQIDFIREAAIIGLTEPPTINRLDYPPVINGPSLPIYPN